MRNNSWDSSREVMEVSGRLKIAGESVAATDLSVTRSIPSNLPEQVSGTGGFSATTGSATVLPLEYAVDRSPTPWGSSTPQPLSEVEAFAVSGSDVVPVFSGIVDSAKGKASDPDNDIKLVDVSDRLSRPISMWPLCSEMPPPTTTGSTNKRNIDLMTTYYVDHVLRKCDFFATPPKLAYCVMSAPMQGSTWPEEGTLWTSHREGTIQNNPWWREVPWGVAAKSVTAEYHPNIDQWGAVDGTLSNRPLEIVVCAGPTQNTSCRISAEWDDGAGVAIAVTSSRSVIGQVRFSGGEWTSFATATAGELGKDWRVASLRIEPGSDSKALVTIKTDTSGTTRLRTISIPYSAWNRKMETVRLDIPDNEIGGIQVGFPGRAHEATNHVPTAILSGPVSFNSLRGNPAISEVPAIELLKDWSEAECAAMWIDEDGVFRWKNRNDFVSGAPVTTVTSSNNLLDLSWSHDVQGARRQVIVEYQDVAAQWSKRSRVEVWQGSGSTMEPGDVIETMVTIPDDEAWIGLDMSPQEFQAETSKLAFNRAEGSWVGYVGYDSKGDENGNGKYVGYTHEVERVTTKTFKITQSWTGNAPSGVDHIKLQTRDGGTTLKPQWQGVNLPLFRAQTKLMFADATRVANVGGPRNSPDLKHETGWWVQTKVVASDLAYWLARQTKKPLPVIDEVDIIPDPRLQLGDKIHVHDTHRTGMRITGIITKIDSDISAGDYSMSLKLLVTAVMADKPTLSDYDSVFSGASLSSRDEKWDGATLAQFDSNPLDR